jgi:predicted anti-sigma-YlaC factor YlaD
VKCSACRNQLGAYQDGTLPADVAARLRAHLDTCVGCRVFAEEMMVVEHRLAQLSTLEPRPDFTQLVMTAVRAMPAPAPRRSRIVWLGIYDLLAWALLIALAATGVLHWRVLAADGGLTLGKFVVTADSLYHIADHFHLVTVALFGGLAEGLALLLVLYAGRHYLSRVQTALFGAQAT